MAVGTLITDSRDAKFDTPRIFFLMRRTGYTAQYHRLITLYFAAAAAAAAGRDIPCHMSISRAYSITCCGLDIETESGGL